MYITIHMRSKLYVFFFFLLMMGIPSAVIFITSRLEPIIIQKLHIVWALFFLNFYRIPLQLLVLSSIGIYSTIQHQNSHHNSKSTYSLGLFFNCYGDFPSATVLNSTISTFNSTYCAIQHQQLEGIPIIIQNLHKVWTLFLQCCTYIVIFLSSSFQIYDKKYISVAL